MKFVLSFLLICFPVTTVVAEEIVDPSEGYVEDFGNDIGDRLSSIAGRGYNTVTRQSCERGSEEELRGINCSGGYEYVGLNVPDDVRAIENMQEELIFLEAARRTHRFSVCQQGLHDRYVSDSEARAALHQNAFEQFNQVRDHVRELHGVIERETAVIENVQQNFSYAEDRYNPAYAEAQRRRFASQGRRAEANQRLEALLSRMPLGNRPEMKQAMVQLASTSGEVSKESFDRSFSGVMGILRGQTRQSLEFFRPLISEYRKSDGEIGHLYRVNEDFKRDLINTGQIENVVNSLNMEQRYRDNFMCRINTYYSTGPMVLEIAQIPLYFAGGYGLARLALRAGATAIRAASVTGRVAASGTQLAARAGIVGLEAYDWAQVGADIQASCFPNEYTVGSQEGDCNPENEIFNVYQEASIAQCLTSSVLGIAPMAGAGVAFFRSARYESRLLSRTPEPTPDVTPAPAGEGDVIVVTGTRNMYVSARERDRVLGSLQRKTNLSEEQIQNMEFSPEHLGRLSRKERITLIEEATAQRFSDSEARAILNLVENGNRGLDPARFQTRQRELRRLLTESGVPEDEVNALSDRLLNSGALGRVPPRTPAGNSGLVISDATPRVRTDVTVRTVSGSTVQGDSPAPTTRTPASSDLTVTRSGPRDPEEIIQNYTGSNYTLEDREMVIDIILGSPRKNEYLRDRDLVDPYRIRYAELEERINNDPNRGQYADEIREFSRNRVASGNERAARELEELKRRNNVSDEDIDCAAMNRVYPSSFPDSGGVCKRVTFNEDVNGQYCACGNMSKTTFNWLVRCPNSVGDFRSLMGFADDLALPSGSLPDMCSRVDIPRGKECYMGSTSVTFAGFGGAVQLLCMDAGGGRLSDEARASVTENRLQIGNPRIQARRWSPFSDFPEYQAIVERAARSCPERCTPEELAQIERQFAEATQAIRSRSTNPMDIQRLEREQASFQDYFGDLRNGRLPTPALSRASRYTDEQRISQARRILRVDELTPRQQEAIQRAHLVGASEGRGYFTFEQRDISEKARILREAGFSRDQIRRLMTNGIVGGRPDEPLRLATSSANNADELVRRSAQATRNRQEFDTTELQRLRRESAQSYEVAATLDDNPMLIRASVDQYLMGGDTEGARRVLAYGERNGQSRQAQLRELRQDLQSAEQRLQRSPSDPAIILEVEARRNLVRSLTPDVRPVRTPAQTQSPTTTPTPTPTPTPVRRSPSELSVSAARSEGNRLRMAGNYEEASTYFARAAERRTLRDRDFANAYEYSLRGNGTVVESHLQELQSRSSVDELNAFLWEIHERNLYRSPDATFRANLNRVLKTVDQSKLFSPQRREIQSWIRNTEP